MGVLAHSPAPKESGAGLRVRSANSHRRLWAEGAAQAPGIGAVSGNGACACFHPPEAAASYRTRQPSTSLDFTVESALSA